MNLFRPVFVDGRVEFLVQSTTHLVDVGGPVSGGLANGMQTHFEEPLKFPPTLLYANDIPVRPIFNFMLENNRVPQLMLGDLRALYGCLVIGERQLLELIDRGGFANVRAAGMYAIEQTEASMRAGIAKLPDGDYTAEDFLDEDGVVNEKIPVHVTVKVRGDSMEIDFSGSGRQPLGNVGTAWCEATRCVQAVKMLVDPSTPVNSGTMRPIETLLPAGSVVQSLPPTSVSNHPRHRIAQHQRGVAGARQRDGEELRLRHRHVRRPHAGRHRHPARTRGEPPGARTSSPAEGGAARTGRTVSPSASRRSATAAPPCRSTSRSRARSSSPSRR